MNQRCLAGLDSRQHLHAECRLCNGGRRPGNAIAMFNGHRGERVALSREAKNPVGAQLPPDYTTGARLDFAGCAARPQLFGEFSDEGLTLRMKLELLLGGFELGYLREGE